MPNHQDRPAPHSGINETKRWIASASQEDMLEALTSEDGMGWLQWHAGISGTTLFHFAAKFAYVDVLKTMVKMGYDPADTDTGDDNALHYALVYSGSTAPGGEKECIEFLLDCGLARPDNNADQTVPIVQLIIDRQWRTNDRSVIEWLVLAAEKGMSLVEDGGENMGGSPIQFVARKGGDDALADMHEAGLFSSEQLKDALYAATIQKQARGNMEQLPMPRSQAIVDRFVLGRNTPDAHPSHKHNRI